jgi:delta24-sterol reductase
MPASQSEQPPFKPLGVFEYLLTHYRGIFATVVLIPISLVFGWYIRLRAFAARCRYSAPELHDSRVKWVIEQLRRWEKECAPIRLTTSRSGWFSMSQYVAAYKKTNRAIEMPMYDIIAIDDETGTVTVEPLVNMGQLSRALNAKGWTLAVVPELDALTVGGLINGFGVESSSHKYGLFQYIVESFDLVTPDGRLRLCSPTENAELFYTVPWSHGTLGFLVAAELKMIRCKPFVRLEYRAIGGLSTIVSEFEKAARDAGNEFVEMLQYGRDEAVLMTGGFADAPRSDGAKNSIGRWYKPWFYTHARRALTRTGPVVEYIPLGHYYHRHTRGLFWEMGEVIPFGNHPLFRLLLGWALPPEISLMKYCETRTTERLREKYHVV